MPWFRLDDGWLMHPKHRAAGLHGRALFVAIGTHCAQQLTDGWIDKTSMPVIIAIAEVPAKTVNRLLEIGILEDHGDRYYLHHFLDFNPSRDSVLRERERWKRSKQKKRADSTRASDEVSTVDTHEDATEESPPSRPVPSRPTEELTSVDQSSSTACRADFDDVIRTIANTRLARALDRDLIDNPDGYLATVLRNLPNELGPAIVTTIAQHPDWTTDQVAARHGGPLASIDDITGPAA